MSAVDGIDILKKQLATLPAVPGVYRMLDADDNVLYVGKAKDLKKRVSQYTQPERLVLRIRRMVFETRKLVIVETASEAEALLLEANLIKSLRPKYNISLKDDSSYPSIWLSAIDDALPTRLQVRRGKAPKEGETFGPYPNAAAAYEAAELIEKVFKVRTCSDGFYKSRTRPCLKYHIKRCSAPCTGRISRAAYNSDVEEALLFLRGKGQKVQQTLQERMLTAAAKEDFEAAARERDRLQLLNQVLSRQSVIVKGLDDADVMALVHEGGQLCVQVFTYRGGAHMGNNRFFPKGADEAETDAEIMRLFMALHYATRPVPRLVLTNLQPAEVDTLTEALSLQAKRQVRIETPQRGDRAKVVEQAVENARSALHRKLAESGSQKTLLAAFAALLNHPTAIERIECFDISNTQGKQPVASMVVADTEGMKKSDYRKFAIKGKNTPDDYTMMREALTRRYGRLQKEGEAENWPDVIMVDGGLGHLHVLEQVFAPLNPPKPVTLCAIAKGEERDKGLEKIFRSGNNTPLDVAYGSPLIFLLQRIRDEAHRVAIGYHRQARSKALVQSVLDEIPGVGASRKRALLLQFGSVQGIKNAQPEDLMRVDGISKQLAQTIYDYLHN